MSHSPHPSPDSLDSWKEIAGFFGVSVRTVQLWEAERGLPVHRLPGPRGRIYALRSELEAWRAGPPIPSAEPPAPYRAWRWISALAALAILTFLTAWSFSPRHLAGHRLDGQFVIGLDQNHDEIWRADLGRPISQSAVNGLQGRGKPWLGDLDGDGDNELLLADLQDNTPNRDRLLCYSSSGKLLWSATPGRAVSTGRVRFDPTFRIEDFRVLRAGPRRQLSVILLSRHQLHYPFQVALLSTQGKLLREYWHSGHLRQLAVGDLQRKGQDTVYLAGCNNARKAATLVVLDPQTMTGASQEEDSTFQLLGFPPPQEQVRILFPVTRPARRLADYAVASSVLLLQNSIAVTVDEIPWLGDFTPKADYHFSPDLQLSHVGIEDNYEASLRRAGRPGQRVTPQDLQDLHKITLLPQRTLRSALR